MTIQHTSDTFQWSKTTNQIVATITVNLIILGFGSNLGWTSSALSVLSSDKTPLLDEPLSNEQLSWVGSMSCIGSLFGAFCFEYIISLVGCKRTALLLTIPFCVFWLLVYFGNLYYHILLARFINGWGGGLIQTAVIVYVSEISNDNLRGRLASMSLLLRNIGTLLIFVLGGTVNYHTIPCICITIPIIFAICFTFLPNTPQFYLQKGQIQKAGQALKFYKGSKESVEDEKSAIHAEFERLKIVMNERKTSGEKLHLKDIFNRRALKGLGIGIALNIFVEFTGGFTIVSYAVMLFEKFKTPIDPHVASIIVAVALIFGSLISTLLADKLGRKTLNVTSLFGSSFGLFAASLYHYLNLSGYDLSGCEWVPVVSLSTVIFMSASGIWALAIVCSVECLPHKVQNFGMATVVFANNVAGFISVKIFPVLLDIVDLHGSLMVYVIFSIIGAFFVLFVMEETSGQPLDSLESNNISQNEKKHEMQA